MADEARKTVRLGRAGGSRTVVLPKAWVEPIAIDERVDLVLRDRTIVIESPRETGPSIEDDPEFPRFLDFLARTALVSPETLVGLRAPESADALFATVALDPPADREGES
jgi:hypothetical protein